MSRALGLTLGLALLLAAGCHATEGLPLPPIEGTGTLLLVSWEGEALSGIWAVELSDETPSYPYLPSRGDTRLAALEYRCGLGELKLPKSGALALLAAPGPKVQLPAPSAVHRFSEADGTWATVSEPDPELQAALQRIDLPPDHLCQLYGATYASATYGVPTPSFQRTGVALSLPDGSVLLSVTSSRTDANTIFYRLRPGTRAEEVTLTVTSSLGRPTTPPADAGLLDPSGDIWLLGTDGRLARGTLEKGFTTFAQQTSGGFRSRLAGRADRSELYAARVKGRSGVTLDAYDGFGWQELLRTQGTGIDPTVVYLGPGELLVTGYDGNRGGPLRVHVGTGTASVDRLSYPPRPPEHVNDSLEFTVFAGETERWGPVVGTAFLVVESLFRFNVTGGGLLRFAGEKLERIEETRVPVAVVYASEIDARTLLFGGRVRLFADDSITYVLHRQAGYCGEFPSRETPLRVLPFGSGALLVSDVPSQMTLIERTAGEGPACLP